MKKVGIRNMDTTKQPSCLDCAHWSSRWNTVPRKDGCQIWGQLAPLVKGATSGSIPAGTSSVQDGLLCPQFELFVPSPKDDLSQAELDQLSLLQQDVRSLYAELCRLERSVSKLASFQGVDDEVLCQEVRAPAHDLQRFFRPLKTEISSFDEVLSKGFCWKDYVSAFLARRGSAPSAKDGGSLAVQEGTPAPAVEGGVLAVDEHLVSNGASTGFSETEAPAGDKDPSSHDGSEISGSECLKSFTMRFAELRDRLNQVGSKAAEIKGHADELPAIMEERQEAARLKRIEGLQEDYDWEFKEALIRYRGLNQRILHLRFFERAKRDELLEQKKRQVRRLERINETYAGTGVKLNDLADLDVVSSD